MLRRVMLSHFRGMLRSDASWAVDESVRRVEGTDSESGIAFD